MLSYFAAILLASFLMHNLVASLDVSLKRHSTARKGPAQTEAFMVRNSTHTYHNRPSEGAQITKPASLSSNPNATSRGIPGLVSEQCSGPRGRGSKPCVAYCSTDDHVCQSAASSVVKTCLPSWSSFYSVQESDLSNQPIPTGEGWSFFTKLVGSPYTTTMTSLEYTTFSTTNTVLVKQNPSPIPLDTPDESVTITPVYALGTPKTDVWVTVQGLGSSVYLTAPTPQCRYNWWTTWVPNPPGWSSFDTSIPTTSCGQCTLLGGNVQLYFWPPETRMSYIGNHPISEVNRTTVLNGTTLFSPTVYIAFHQLSASNSCGLVGKVIPNTLLGMKAADVSTLVHWGGKVAESGANHYGPLDYHDLTGLPPVSEYEMQPSCIMFGCSTIYPGPWSPTLVVPSPVRSLDPAWKLCDAGLEGIYDPPIALNAQAAMAAVTTNVPPRHVSASPCIAPSANEPKQTWSPQTTTSTSSAAQSDALASILNSPQAHRSSHQGLLPTISSNGEQGQQITHTSVTNESSVQAISSGADTLTHDPNSVGSVFTGTSSIGTETMVTTQGPIAPSSMGDTGETPAAIPAHPNPSSHEVPVGSQRAAGATSQSAVVKPTNPLRTSSVQLTDPALGSGISQATISTDSEGQFLVNGQTFAPGSTITLQKSSGPLTYQMLTSDNRTFIAIGTSSTVPLGTTPSTSADDAYLAFTQASDGNFLLQGTTLASGKPITIGSGPSQTTLRMISIHGTPAVVVDGTDTEILAHGTSSTSITSKTPLRDTQGSATRTTMVAPTREAVPTSSTPRSGGETVHNGHVIWRLVSLAAVFISML